MNHEEKIIGMLEQLFISQQETNKRLDKLEQNVARIEVNHGQKLDALFDGYKMMSEKIDQLSLVEAQEDDMAVMKAAIKHLSSKIAELEKAI